MVFKGPAGFQRIVYILMNVIIGIVMSTCITLFVLKAPLTPGGIIQSSVLSFFIGYTVADLVPAMTWGQLLAATIGVRKLAAHVVSSAVLAFFMGTFILLFCAIVNTLAEGGPMAVAGFFVSAYPIVLAVAFVCVVAFLPLCVKVATCLSGFDPAKPQG